MGSLLDGVKTINSAVRTLLLTGLLLVVGSGIYFAYDEYTKRERLIAEQADQIRLSTEKVQKLTEEISEKNRQIERMETSMKLLKTDHRLAQLRVLSIERNDAGKAVRCKLEFVEMSPQGDAMSQPKTIELPGDVVYIDNWIVQFDDAYVEKGDIERGTSLCLFRRIFSEDMQPNAGIALDEVGMRPQAYARGGNMSDFEKQLWSEFWEFANNREKAEAMGIRAANGEAVSIKVREGKSYGITLRASGGLSIEPLDSGK